MMHLVKSVEEKFGFFQCPPSRHDRDSSVFSGSGAGGGVVPSFSVVSTGGPAWTVRLLRGCVAFVVFSRRGPSPLRGLVVLLLQLTGLGYMRKRKKKKTTTVLEHASSVRTVFSEVWVAFPQAFPGIGSAKKKTTSGSWHQEALALRSDCDSDGPSRTW